MKPEAELRPYFQRKNELTIEEKGMQVIVPPDLQKNAMKLLHESRPGVKMRLKKF